MLYLPHNPIRRTRRNAFTLIELLVVISIISLLVGLSFPYIRGMLRSSSEQMAANSISNAIQATRAYSTPSLASNCCPACSPPMRLPTRPTGWPTTSCARWPWC